MNKRIVILGAGISGVGSAILAKKQGFEVFVSDFGKITNKNKELLIKENIDFEEGKHTTESILNANEIIKSPGIPESVDIIISAKEKNIPIISEIEFAARYTNAKMICITGSNGKTTTTELTYHIYKNAGLNVAKAGNVGKSFALQVANENYDYYILELSSFQLDGMFNFKADVAILLNITPDHLNRYNNNFQNYINSKFRITQNMTEDDIFIYCEDDETIKKEIKKRKIKPKTFSFSVKNELKKGAYKTLENIFININSKNFKMENSLLSLEGDHNIYNSMAAGISSLTEGISNQDLKKSFSDFAGVEHRLEKYIKVRGIQFINDSKATNVNSTWYALQSINDPIILIMGGKEEGNDYSAIKDLVRRKVKAIIALGTDNEKIIKTFEDISETYNTNTMEDAVKTAYKLGKEGDVVLLSPACKSFDLFKNFEDRGIKFKNAVRNL